MNQADVVYEPVDYARRPLTREQLDDIMGGAPPPSFVNARSPSFRNAGIVHEDLSDDQSLEFMLENNASIRRPVVADGDMRIVGFDAQAYEALAQQQKARGSDG